MAGVGDVDGDGHDDVVVGAPGFDDGEPEEGRAFLYRGSDQGLDVVPAWTAESDQDGTVNGVHFGANLAAAGDVDGDGYDDVVVAGHNYTGTLDGEGRAWVFHGSAQGLEDTPAWSALGGQEWAEFGYSVSTAGDVNADGYDDLLVAARNHSNGQNYEGRVYCFFGSEDGLEATPSWSAESNAVLAHFGESVTGGGDFDGDGYDDVVVSEEDGPVGLYAFHGSAQGLDDVARWTVAPGGPLWAVAVAGDVNGDGFDDLVAGGWTGAYLYLGSADGLSDEAHWTATSPQGGLNFGFSVAGAGDVNADGLDDVIVGEYDAPDGDAVVGLAFVFHGSADGLEEAAAWTGRGEQELAQYAFSVAGAGDVDADGFADVIVGAPYFSEGEATEGLALLYRGAVDDGTPCDGGLYHDSVCDDSHCFIGGAWTLNGESDAADACHVCLVTQDRLDWTAADDGSDCDEGLCRAGACEASCFVDDAWYAEGDPSPDDACATCSLADDPRAFTPAAEGTPCSEGLCHDGHCSAAECFVRGAWIVNAMPNPDEACQLCDVDADATDWTNAPDGSVCDAGLCREGACEDRRCYIGGQWYVDGAADADDACRTCDVAVSRVEWTTALDEACGEVGPPGDGDEGDGCSCQLAGRGGDGGSVLAALAGLAALVSRRSERRSRRRRP